MKSKWKVTSQYLADGKVFAVYRTINTDEVDHSGNRELATGYMDSKEEASAIAEKLNNEKPKAPLSAVTEQESQWLKKPI